MLIGLTGKAGSGKDTVGEFLKDTFNFNTYAFADPLKEAAAIAFGVDVSVFYDRDVKETEDPFWNITYREIAQKFGTECMRDQFRDDFWIKRAEMELQRLNEQNDTGKRVRFCVTDVRFPNEAAWIKDAGGIIMEVVRDGVEDIALSGHASETMMSQINPDIRIINDGTLEDLYAKVDKSYLNWYNI